LTSPKRIQENLTNRAERRVLDWLCARLPLWLTPDRLTALGFMGAVLVAVGFAMSNFGRWWLLLAIAGFALNWFGDSLDGSIARFRKIERPNYGYFIDHSLDALANTLLVLGMGISPYLRMDTALIGLVGYLLLSVHTFISARIFGVFQLSYLGGGPTEMRLALMVMTGLMFWIGPETWVVWPVGGLMFSPFDVFVCALGAFLTGIFVFHTIRTGAVLFKKGG
jgi:archaetidylinositol phosphate synthase